MTSEWLEDFICLCEKKSFSKAAEARNVSQSAFSRRIQALEHWVGTPLILRLTRQFHLTKAGIIFQEEAEAIIIQLKKIRQLTRDIGREKQVLSFAATHGLSFSFFPQWINTLLKSENGEALNLFSDTMEACEEMMQRGDVSFLLCHYHKNAEARLKLPFIKIGEDWLIPLCLPNEKGKPRFDITNNTPYPALTYSASSGLGRIITACDLNLNPQSQMTAHLAAVLLTMVKEGRGVAFIPQLLAKSEMETGSLVEAGGGKFNIKVDIVLYRRNETLNDTMERFWQSIC